MFGHKEKNVEKINLSEIKSFFENMPSHFN